MTFAELDRAITAKKKQEKRKAAFDYILADLVGRSIARVYNSQNTYPSLAEAYPSLFDKAEEEEELQRKKDELSALRFKQFALTYNKNHKEV